MLSCQKLSKSFGKKLFSDLNFNLDEGEILAVVGPSGCGKTTLLRCICGLEVLDSGKILGQVTINILEMDTPKKLARKLIIKEHIFKKNKN